jgi:hypothetical protein
LRPGRIIGVGGGRRQDEDDEEFSDRTRTHEAIVARRLDPQQAMAGKGVNPVRAPFTAMWTVWRYRRCGQRGVQRRYREKAYRKR